MDLIKVYVKTDDVGICAVNSSIFLQDATGWTQIGEGQGDRYAHAQGQYLNQPLFDDQSCHNYKLVAGQPTLRTAEEKQAELDARPVPPKTETQILRDDVNSTTLGMEITRTALTFKINQLQSMVEGLLPSTQSQEG
jgi:hypothetical protein